MSAHTPDRLMAGTISIVIHGVLSEFHCVGIEGTNKAIATTGFVGGDAENVDAVSEADARRLAACWNAMEGVTTHDIEAFTEHMESIRAHVGKIGQVHTAIEAERDQLRAEVVGVRAALAGARGERDQLRAELAAAQETIAAVHANYDDLRAKWDAERFGRADDKAGAQVALERANDRWSTAARERDAARTILVEVHAFATGAPAPIGSAECHTLAKLGERVGVFLKGGA